MAESNKRILLKMASALVILLVAWCFKDFLLLHAGLDWHPRSGGNERKDKLGRVARMDGPDRVFEDTLLKPLLKVRHVFSPGHQQVREFIVDHFTRLNWKVEEDFFSSSTPLGDLNFTNIVATTTYPSSSYLVLACHYDSKFFENMDFIGATDSAVPCAIMLQIAQSLNPYLQSHTQGKVGLKLLFFDGEEALVTWTREDSIYGSRHLADVMSRKLVNIDVDKAISELQQIDLFVLLDLIGTEETSFKNIQYKTSRDFNKFASIERKMQQHGLLDRPNPRTLFDSSYYDYRIEDDHIPFLEKGVPVVHLISIPFPKHWHKVGDDATSLHTPTIRDIMKIVRMFVVDYLNLDV